jgi:hypothetical protein
MSVKELKFVTKIFTGKNLRVTFYQNSRLAKIDAKVYPIYISITYRGMNSQVKSLLFESIAGFEAEYEKKRAWIKLTASEKLPPFNFQDYLKEKALTYEELCRYEFQYIQDIVDHCHSGNDQLTTKDIVKSYQRFAQDGLRKAKATLLNSIANDWNKVLFNPDITNEYPEYEKHDEFLIPILGMLHDDYNTNVVWMIAVTAGMNQMDKLPLDKKLQSDFNNLARLDELIHTLQYMVTWQVESFDVFQPGTDIIISTKAFPLLKPFAAHYFPVINFFKPQFVTEYDQFNKILVELQPYLIE